MINPFYLCSSFSTIVLFILTANKKKLFREVINMHFKDQKRCVLTYNLISDASRNVNDENSVLFVFHFFHGNWSPWLEVADIHNGMQPCTTRVIYIYFFYVGFLLPTFTNHKTAEEGGGNFINSSLPPPPASKTVRHQPCDYCTELTSLHKQRLDSNR